MLKNNNVFLFFVLVVFTLFSCTTDTEAVREIPTYNEALLNKIQKLFDDDKPAAVIQICSTIDDERINIEKVRAVKKLKNKYDEQLKKRLYFEAAESFKSLVAADIEVDNSLIEIYMLEVVQEINNGAITPALALFQNRVLDRGKDFKINNENIKLLIDAAVENGNKAVIKELLERYPEYAPDEIDELKAIVELKPDTEKLISGTVTIWVNRGIKLERGVGYPDRIIGSGFYIDNRGYILTNYHVISSEVDPEYEGFSRLYIKYDQKEEKIPARVIGWDSSLDIALLKIEHTPEYFYSFPKQRDYKPGEIIYAIGSPGGLDKTITSGIISNSGNRRLLPIGDTIQVDVPINSGNSGGPVVDANGNLVGVVFAGIEQFEGVNFIIPVKWILNSLPELYREGRNRQAWLGLTMHERNDGLEIIYIMPGTAAFSAGVQPGDEIVSIDEIKTFKIPEAQELIQSKRPGTLLKLRVRRSDKEIDYLLSVEERDDMPMEKALELDSRYKLLAPFLGMIVDKGEENTFGQEYIIKKVYRGTAADETGLSVNDPFTIVNWQIDDENDILIVGIRIKKKKAGFLETVIQLGNYIDINNTI